MRTVALVPMKLVNRRLPNKNTKPLSDGKPLCSLILKTLESVSGIDEIYVYCSSPEIKAYIPDGVRYLSRSDALDKDTTLINEVIGAFAEDVKADVYLLTHATAPFISKASIEKGLKAVLGGKYDSAFAVRVIPDFLWKDGKPFNYELDKIPRTQDLPPIYKETSGFYIYTSDVVNRLGRRIGERPYMVEVSETEAVDVDTPEDFEIASAIYSEMINKKRE